jgi:hypothetical protein
MDKAPLDVIIGYVASLERRIADLQQTVIELVRENKELTQCLSDSKKK